MAAARMSLTPAIVVVIALSVDGEPCAQISLSVPVGMTFLRLPRQPSLGQTYTTAQYRLPPAFSTRPTTRKTPVSLATCSSLSLVPSPLYSFPLLTSNFLFTQSCPAPLGVSPRSTALRKYCRNCSRPISSREPTAAPKEQVRG